MAVVERDLLCLPIMRSERHPKARIAHRGIGAIPDTISVATARCGTLLPDFKLRYEMQIRVEMCDIMSLE